MGVLRKEPNLFTDAVAWSSTKRDVRVRMSANSLVLKKTFGIENQRIRKYFGISMRS
jgi:ribosomal protein L28